MFAKTFSGKTEKIYTKQLIGKDTLYFSITNIDNPQSVAEEASVIKSCLQSLDHHPEIKTILIDLNKARRINSDFFGLLIDFKNSLRKKGRSYTIKIVNPSDPALKILELLKLDRYFDIDNFYQTLNEEISPFYIYTNPSSSAQMGQIFN